MPTIFNPISTLSNAVFLKPAVDPAFVQPGRLQQRIRLQDRGNWTQ
jgi:hypothetical protein